MGFGASPFLEFMLTGENFIVFSGFSPWNLPKKYLLTYGQINYHCDSRLYATTLAGWQIQDTARWFEINHWLCYQCVLVYDIANYEAKTVFDVFDEQKVIERDRQVMLLPQKSYIGSPRNGACRAWVSAYSLIGSAYFRLALVDVFETAFPTDFRPPWDEKGWNPKGQVILELTRQR